MYSLEHLAQLHWVDNCMEVFRNCYRYQENIMLIETSPSSYIQLPANLTLHGYSTATTFATTHECIALLLEIVKENVFVFQKKKKFRSFCFSFMWKLFGELTQPEIIVKSTLWSNFDDFLGEANGTSFMEFVTKYKTFGKVFSTFLLFMRCRHLWYFHTEWRFNTKFAAGRKVCDGIFVYRNIWVVRKIVQWAMTFRKIT